MDQRKERRQTEGRDVKFLRNLDGNRRTRRGDAARGCCVGGVLTCLFGLCASSIIMESWHDRGMMADTSES